jgi:hypothetical protein
VYRPPDKPFLKQELWNYLRVPAQALTGANTFRTLIYQATENTVIKYVDIFNNGDDGSNINLIYVSATQGGAGVTMGYGWAWNYHDFIHSTEFVVPSGYYLTLIGASIPTFSVGFSLTYKGGLVLRSDVQSA